MASKTRLTGSTSSSQRPWPFSSSSNASARWRVRSASAAWPARARTSPRSRRTAGRWCFRPVAWNSASARENAASCTRGSVLASPRTKPELGRDAAAQDGIDDGGRGSRGGADVGARLGPLVERQRDLSPQQVRLAGVARRGRERGVGGDLVQERGGQRRPPFGDGDLGRIADDPRRALPVGEGGRRGEGDAEVAPGLATVADVRVRLGEQVVQPGDRLGFTERLVTVDGGEVERGSRRDGASYRWRRGPGSTAPARVPRGRRAAGAPGAAGCRPF